MKTLYLFFLISVATIFLSSCSASKLLSSWKDESLEQGSISPVLVIGVVKHDETKRRIYEDTFVDSFKSAGTNAMASYTLSKAPIEPHKTALREIIKKAEAKTILITHMVSSQEKDFFQPSSRIIGTNSYSNQSLFSYYPFIYNSVSSSGSYISTTKVLLETSLYDVKTEKLIWTARTESIDPVMTRKYYQQLIDLFLQDLADQKIL
ncbi:MAG: hypothetical protein JKY62_08780 [Desulfocapsa sp.]|uniref:Lipoprotein n=1 Tax=Desulfotalea psychrophila TaxID=84980 RepID=A0ABS3AVQ2_9BACT|nr:hypothetical protein [Desulfocapsa sp.]MBN4067937.1 hypothetical protein [Desulfotalea psychrophila]